MLSPDFPQFLSLATQGNFIPVYQEWVADLDTPVSAWYRVCADRSYNFLLESVEGGANLGRYSILGCDPLWILETRGAITTQTHRDGQVEVFNGDPFGVLKHCLQPYQPVKLPQLPPGIGGLFGYWGYELISWIEPRVPTHPLQAQDLPDGLWMQVDHLLIFDQVQRKIWVVAYADLRSGDPGQAYQTACDRVRDLVARLSAPLPAASSLLSWRAPDHSQPQLAYQSPISPSQFCQGVERARKLIYAGDIFQVTLSQPLEAVYSGHPFDLYRSLRLINPSPYMAYFQWGDWQMIGSSPEVMVKAERDGSGKMTATLRPIAGTRPRGADPTADDALAQELRQDPKEVAEHIMLVDLGRNDLGRVCRQGTVRVEDLMVVERYSHVMHLVSQVTGELDSDKGAWELMKACFPAGTVSGAPKIRAMEIIYELEGARRGLYAGAYGYYDFEGQLNTAITIRTMVVTPRNGADHLVRVQAGAGLVADSQPEREYQETLNKARGMLEAIRCLAKP